MTAQRPRQDFWRDRRVLVTGRTGFKGAVARNLIEAYRALSASYAKERDRDD